MSCATATSAIGPTDRTTATSRITCLLLTAYLTKSGCNPAQIAKALYELRTEAVNPNRSLYGGAGDAA